MSPEGGRAWMGERWAVDRRRALLVALLLLVVAVGVLPGSSGAQASGGRWVLDGVDPAAPAAGITHTAGAISKVVSQPIRVTFSATYSVPPATIQPGSSVALAVQVSGALGSTDLRGETALEVIQLVNGRWNNISIGSFARCQPNPFPLGPIACTPPSPASATFAYSAPTSGTTFSIGVGILNANSAITWRYRFEAAGATTTTSTTRPTTTTSSSTSSTSSSTSTSVAAAGPKPPVILLPGVAGSSLASAAGAIWPLPTAANRADLEMDETGNPFAVVSAGAVLTTVPVDFYGGMVWYLRDRVGYVVGKDLYTFPYDWRRSNELHFAALDRLVDQAIASSGQPKVALLAHSMGGLIARGYVLSDARRAAKVDSVVTMGTPFGGSPKVYYALVEGYTFGNPTVSQSLMKALVQNFPAAYQLLPREPFVYDDRIGRELSLDETNDVVYEKLLLDGSVSGLQSPNDDLLAMAGRFHASGGSVANPTPLPAGIELHTIMGVQVQTVTGFAARAPKEGESFLFLGDKEVVLEPLFGDGDGTVPLASLELSSATARYYVPWSAEDKTAHGDLPSSDRVQDIVGRILTGRPPAPSDHSYGWARPADRYDPEPGVDFTLHSDAYLRIESAAGALGVTAQGNVVESLAGSFVALNGGEYASLPNGGPYDVIVTGVRSGTFSLVIERRLGGSTVTVEYRDVPVAAGTVATISVDPATFVLPNRLEVRNAGVTSYIEARISTVGGADDGGGPVMAVAGAAVAAVALAAVAVLVLRRRRTAAAPLESDLAE